MRTITRKKRTNNKISIKNVRIKVGSGKIIKTKKINCSPKPKYELNEFSCYTNKKLIELRDKWNARHPDVKINTNAPKEIHTKLTEHLKYICTI